MLYSWKAINCEDIMFVYVWKHNNTPFYVGMTKSAGRTNPLNSGGRGWLCKKTIQEIGKINIVSEVHIVDSIEKAKELEKELIFKYGRIQLGTGTLTNLTLGGDGSHNLSKKSKEKLSKRMKENNPARNPETKEKIKLRLNSPDVKNKFLGDNNPAKRPEVRAKLLAKWQEPEYREKQIAKKIGKSIHSEKEKQLRRERLLDPSNPMREQHKILNTDPEIKQKRVNALRTPEVQAKISAGLKAAWAKRKGIDSSS